MKKTRNNISSRELFEDVKFNQIKSHLIKDLNNIEDKVRLLVKELKTHLTSIRQDTIGGKAKNIDSVYSGRTSVSTNITNLSDETMDETGFTGFNETIGADKWLEMRSKITLIPIE